MDPFNQDKSLQASDTVRPAELYASIIIPFALPKTYTWSIPVQYEGLVKVGMRVEVSLKSKKYAGIISGFVSKPEGVQPKAITAVLDEEPLVHGQQLSLWKWIAEYYMCSEGEVMLAAVPSNFRLSSESILVWNDEHNEDFTKLSDNEYIIAEALLIKKELTMTEVQQLLENTRSVYHIVKGLVDKQVCIIWENLKEKYAPKTESYVCLNPVYNDESKLEDLVNNWLKAPKQLDLLLSYLHLLKTEGDVTQTALLKKSGASSAQLKGLVEKNILRTEKRNRDRIASLPKNINVDFELSAVQEEALNAVRNSFNSKQVCLLHGVTSSGKTQVYVKLIEECIRQGTQVLYMLPEIALTSQIIRRLQKHFGGYIGIYHSRFNDNERVEVWNKVKSGEVKIVLGARSSLFLPFKSLGLVILDEEHETSYKQQDTAPRYHARDAAIYYASLFKAKVLLGSATPSLESYYNALSGKYALVTLSQRYGDVAMPNISIADLRKFLSKQKLIVSPPLEDAINVTLANRKQVILFQNRRGYSPYVTCNVCGWIPQCSQCSVSLTYHKNKNKLTCHYCGSNYPVIQTCAACGSQQFVRKQFGTEKIEETLAEIFPHARVARMDLDTVKGKNAHDNIIKLFEQHKIDILVGTQMVVKGLDFEHVDLVGIVDADNLLHFADFRVNERAFQLMEQVAGRAGRKDKTGEVLIQLNHTSHPVLNYVKEHDYVGFYNAEIEERKLFFYPPISRIIKITCKHKEQHIAEEAANIIATGLRTDFEKYLTGPAEPLINKIRNEYIQELMLRIPKHKPLIEQLKQQVKQQFVMLQNNKRYRAVALYADVDPV